MRSWIVGVCQAASGARAEAKLLLAGLAHHHRQATFSGADGGVVSALGFSGVLAATLMAELVRAKLLENEPVVTGQRGRPAACYQVHPDVLAIWSTVAAGSGAGDGRGEGGYFEEVIQHVLTDTAAWPGVRPTGQGKPPSRQGAANRLNPSNRLLLMVLLGVADRNGVVREWGPSALSRLTGLTPARIEGQVQKLLALGYLRAVVPGVSGRSLFGKRPGAFFLNLSHPDYKGLIGEIVLVYPAHELDHHYRHQGDARMVYLQTQRLRRRHPSGFVKALVSSACNVDSLTAMHKLSVCFDGVGTSTLPEYFQMKLEAYAIQLLVNHLKQEDILVVSHLREVIAQDAFRREFSLLDETQVMYVRLVLHMAERLTTSLQESLSQVNSLVASNEEKIYPCGFTYALIPAISSSRQEGYFVLSAVPAARGSGVPRCYVSGQTLGTSRGSRTLSDEEMYTMGLLTRPTPRPVKAGTDQFALGIAKAPQRPGL